MDAKEPPPQHFSSCSSSSEAATDVCECSGHADASGHLSEALCLGPIWF